MVKRGVKDPDTDSDIAGWQGRICDIFDDEGTVQIQWDSVTLRNISEAHIAWSEEEGLSWSEMNLEPDELESAIARDTEKEVAAAIKEITAKSGWFHIGGEQGKRIQAIVNSAQSSNDLAILRTWHAYLEKHLVFPFSAKVQEDMSGPLGQGTRMRVMSIVSLDRTEGTIVAVRHKGGINRLPLCDLAATEAGTEIAQLVDDYSVWFANR